MSVLTSFLVKLIAYYLVVCYYVRVKFNYVISGGLSFDLRERRKKRSNKHDQLEWQFRHPEIGGDESGYEVIGRDGEIARVNKGSHTARDLEIIDHGKMPEMGTPILNTFSKPDVKVYLNLGEEYVKEVSINRDISTKVTIYPFEWYPMPQIVYSVLKKDDEFAELVADGFMIVREVGGQVGVPEIKAQNESKFITDNPGTFYILTE